MAIVFTAQEGRNFVNANIHGYGDYDLPISISFAFHLRMCKYTCTCYAYSFKSAKNLYFILPLLTWADLALDTH
jgi:hypothetical protein